MCSDEAKTLVSTKQPFIEVERDRRDCPGHFGYLALALPVYNVGYMGTVADILKCICKSCSGVLLKEEMRVELLRRMRNPKLGPLKKTELVKMVVKKCTGLAANNRPVECSKCGYLNGSVKKATGMVAIIHDRSKFGGVMDELRPENLLIMNIPVPPTAIRPSVLVDESRTNENDITERLKNIVQANARLRHDLTQDLPPAYAGGFKHSWDALQVERIKGKQGRFRGNLSAKRVEYTGRSVISPDPNLKINEVGLPIQMAQILTYPERFPVIILRS
ncbi:unnamed protein product [Prunus armeniaca]|uniref:DNA-directed RNA polymerase subunit n=1 Tax=Prunus armeniaca TaxID=36596 RepID=A0A6J5UFA5_PRUAR|nr:unnamed protein product [Prunus armeniaca]